MNVQKQGLTRTDFRGEFEGSDHAAGPARHPVVTWWMLLASCAALGTGVALILTASLGSDGYSTLIRGLSLRLGVDFAVVNVVAGLVLVAVAWWRGVRPGPGTLAQPVVVGVVVSVLLQLIAPPAGLLARSVLLLVAIPVMAVGVAGYLATDTGAGPTEAAALALNPPIPLRWSYSIVQGVGAVTGWLCGAAVGPGTIIAVLALGPLVGVLTSHRWFLTQQSRQQAPQKNQRRRRARRT